MGGKVLKLWRRKEKEMFQAMKQYEQQQELRNSDYKFIGYWKYSFDWRTEGVLINKGLLEIRNMVNHGKTSKPSRDIEYWIVMGCSFLLWPQVALLAG